MGLICKREELYLTNAYIAIPLGQRTETPGLQCESLQLRKDTNARVIMTTSSGAVIEESFPVGFQMFITDEKFLEDGLGVLQVDASFLQSLQYVKTSIYYANMVEWMIWSIIPMVYSTVLYTYGLMNDMTNCTHDIQSWLACIVSLTSYIVCVYVVMKGIICCHYPSCVKGLMRFRHFAGKLSMPLLEMQARLWTP